MSKRLLHEAVRERPFVCDGAMGTELMMAGLEQGSCGEAWNITHPEKVRAIQRRYVEAGADCLITNTFGASPIMLARHDLRHKMREINMAAVRIAREAFGEKDGYVLGDMGPLGAILEPYGDLPVADAYAAYEEQASALMEGGADAIIIETQTSLEELGAAIDAAKKAGAPSIIASLAYDRSHDGTFFVTMMGVKPDSAAFFMQERGAHIICLNCGTGVDMKAAAEIVRIYRESSGLPTMGEPNAGLPVLENGKAVYKQSPEEMGRQVPEMLSAGVNIIGSCCGSTPDHTKAIRDAVDSYVSRRTA